MNITNEKTKNIIIGLDVHCKSGTKYCIQDKETGKVLRKGEFETNYKGLKEAIGNWLKEYPNTEVGMEAGNKAYEVASIISELGGKPRVFSADEVRAKSRSKMKKSDYRDAEDICSNLKAGALQKEVKLPPRKLKELRTLLRLRELYIKQKIQIVNQTRALMKEYGIADDIKSFNNNDSWKELLKKEMPDFLREAFETHYKIYKEVSNEIKKIESKIKQWDNVNAEFNILKTVPGIGDMTCAALKAYIFDINRFDNAKKLVSYFGLAPSCYDSGQTIHHGRITKEGNKYVRKLLIECAQHYSNPRSCFYPFYIQLAYRKGHKKACVALAAKLCRIIYAILKSQKPFDINMLGVIEGPFYVVKKCHHLRKDNKAKIIKANQNQQSMVSG